MVKGPREDVTVAMLTVPVIQRIVEIMLQKFPADSEVAEEILKTASAGGFISNKIIDAILIAIEEEPDLSKIDFNDISNNEPGIIPYYVMKLKKGAVDGIRQKIRVAGTGHQEQ